LERDGPQDQEDHLTAPLGGRVFRDAGRTRATRFAGELLRSLGATPDDGRPRRAGGRPALVLDGDADPGPVDDWAASGAMALTGEPGGPGRPVPGDVAARLRGAALVVGVLSAELGRRVDLDGPALLGERAAVAGLTRQGTVSPGGSCRLLRAHDGWVACNLARRDDFAMLPALMERDVHGDPWHALAGWLGGARRADAVGRAALLGVPIAAVVPPHEAAACDRENGSRDPWLLTHGAIRRRSARPLVVDLSALWAGPLCTSILAAAGADVVKVESPLRPDGARRGPRPFFDLLNAAKRSVCVDLRSEAFRALLDRADAVVESSRPRVMETLGIDPVSLIAERGLIWVSITGYGRAGPWRDRVAFGDDAAAAGGACALIGDDGGPPMVCADAFADPVAGLYAAAAALACLVGYRGALIDVALRRAVTSVFTDAGTERAGRAPDGVVVAPPRARQAMGTGPGLGADTRAVLAELGLDGLE
jgi:hypothetical protein